MKTGKLLWKSEDKEVSSDVCTPLYHDGHFYVLNGEFKDKRLSCIEPRTGKVPWIGELGARTGVTGSTLTHHMKILTAAGLVRQADGGAGPHGLELVGIELAEVAFVQAGSANPTVDRVGGPQASREGFAVGRGGL